MKNSKDFSKIASATIVSSILLVGCSTAEKDEADGAEGKVTVDIFQYKVEFVDQFEKLIEQYESEHPDVNVVVSTAGGGTDYLSSLKASFSSGEGPSIFNVGGPTDVTTYKDRSADLSDTAAAAAALEGTLNGVTVGKEILGLPVNQEGYGLIYNKAIFEKANINPEEIVTYEDLEEAVQTLNSMKDKLEIEAVFALPAKEKWVTGSHLSNVFLAPEFNNDLLKAHNAETVEFYRGDEMQRFLDLQNNYSVQPVNNLDYSQQVEQLFSTGRVAMIQQGNWIYNSVYQMDTDFAENNIGIIPIPVKGEEGKLPVGVPMYWAVNSDKSEEVIEASKDFLDWMYTSEAGKTAVLNDFKFIPAYEDYDTKQIADPLSQKIYQHAAEGNTLAWVFSGYPAGWGEGVVGVNMQQYLAGEMTWEELIADSKKKWEATKK